MRVLVTGANGHLGSNLVRELVGRGHVVVGLVRPTADVRGLQGVAMETVHGDALDVDSIEAAAKGCEAIINLAAIYKLGSRDPAVIVKPAVDGIRNVLQVAARAGVGRVVHTSSTTAVGVSDRPGAVRDETCWNEHPIDAYYQAKTESERQAWALAKELSVPLVCVNPSGILGAYDYRVTPSSGYIEQLASGRSQTIVGALNYVDARDVAFVHAEALERGTAGERYLCVGENLEIRELGARMAALTGRPNPHVALPRWAVLAYAGAVEAIDRLRGVEPRMSRTSIAESSWRWSLYDGRKAQQAFGWKPRTIEDTLEAAIRWGVFMGRVPPEGLDERLTRPDPSWIK